MSIRLLMLTRYGNLGASSRLRGMQYVPALEAADFEVTVEPLFPNAYLESLYRADDWNRRRVANWQLIGLSYAKRLRAVIRSAKFDVVWLEKELFPFLPGFFESSLRWRRVPYVVDFDDAVFHNYDVSPSWLVRKCLGGKLRSLLEGAHAIVAGNDYLAEYACGHGARRVIVMPTAVDTDRYKVNAPPDDEVIRVGWIGTRSTAHYLHEVTSALVAVSKVKRLLLVTVGAPCLNIFGVELCQHDWSLESEAALASSFHIGIMPLIDSPWERGKCGYKLIQYMAAGRPVVASPVGANVQIVTSDVGRLARDIDAWTRVLIELVSSKDTRERLGAAARKRVERDYSLRATAPKLISLLKDAAESSAAPR